MTRLITRLKKSGDSYIVTIPRKERLELDITEGDLLVVDLNVLSEDEIERTLNRRK